MTPITISAELGLAVMVNVVMIASSWVNLRANVASLKESTEARLLRIENKLGIEGSEASFPSRTECALQHRQLERRLTALEDELRSNRHREAPEPAA